MPFNLGGGFGFQNAMSDFTRLGESAGVITNAIQNPTPGLDGSYFASEVTQSASPTLAAQRVIRELGEEKVARTEFDRQRMLGRREVAGRFSSMRNALQRGIAGRGMGRSGFAAEKMGELGAQEGGALAEVEASRTAAIADYNRQLAAYRMQRSADRRARRRANQKEGIGKGLALAGLVAAPFTGGASLLLTGAGASMM